MCFYVFWCRLVLFLVFWLYCIITVTPFKRRSQKAGHFYLARGSWTSRNKNAVFSPKFKSTANFFSSSPGGKPLFPLWEITRHFAQSARGVEETIQLPTLLAQHWLGVVICARVAVALLAVCSRCDLLYKLKFKSM